MQHEYVDVIQIGRNDLRDVRVDAPSRWKSLGKLSGIVDACEMGRCTCQKRIAEICADEVTAPTKTG